MSKKARQYIGILTALIVYYLIHEGAHLLYALSLGAFKKVNFLCLGIQIDIFRERMTDPQLGIFCLVGAIATFLAGYLLVILCDRICKSENMVFKAEMYYTTIVLLLLDPLYLSVLYSFFGGGDMNGIALVVQETAARIGFGVLLLINSLIFWKVVLPKYTRAFHA